MESFPASAAARHLRVSEIFVEIVRHEPAARAAALREACAGDEALLAEVSSLLEQADEPRGFLERPADLSVLERPSEPGPKLHSAVPEVVAGFRIQRVLGWGSMGVVYLARQESPQREIALKVLRAEALSPQMRKRFAREAEVLAGLRHPSIAQIHAVGFEADDAGGRPWFALEYVRGRPLLEYAEDEALDVRARLELFVQICDGVQAAHDQGVVHRDLKPANLLVEDDGRPRILDFGVAHTTDSENSQTLLTQTGQLVGTLAYMSPEQAAGNGGRVDCRADVYSLGVLMFELLTGELPQSTRGLDIPAALRVIREEEPLALRTLRRELDVHLETIAATALAKERERRYSGAGALAADVRRWLADEPIRAQPASLYYQLSKLARRNRGLVTGTATTIASLAAGLVLSLFALDRAHVAEARVREELSASQHLADLRGLDLLRGQVDDLWPATAERADDLRRWLQAAEPIVARQVLNRAWLSAVEVATDLREVEIARELVRALDAFTDDAGGPLVTVRARLEFATTLHARSVDDHAQAWHEAIEAIADVRRHPLYAGLRITPQVGLVPLGPDPDSGLWEFAHFGPSGRITTRDARTGRLDFGGDSAIVLVLIPGGEVTLGVQSGAPGLARHDPQAYPHEGPPRSAVLAPYFLSKFEVTQGQYLRVMGENPSLWEIGDRPYDLVVGPRNPVEYLDWFAARRFAQRLDLELPTEAQWECAARAGNDSVFWTGDRPSSLLCAENIDGSETSDWRLYGEVAPEQVRFDPYSSHAPVGSLEPNPYGLLDMLGNVQEWCLDPYKVAYHDLPLRAGDGLVLATSPDRDRTLRGGGWGMGLLMARSGARTDAREENRSPSVGVRLARELR